MKTNNKPNNEQPCMPVWRIRDVYPGSRISDPGSKNSNKREGWKKIWYHTFLCSHKFHKKIIVHYFSFEVLKKKIWANFQRIIELFARKIVTKLSKVWVWDPGSGIRDQGSGKNLSTDLSPDPIRNRIRNTACISVADPDPGVKKAPDPGSRIRNTDASSVSDRIRIGSGLRSVDPDSDFESGTGFRNRIRSRRAK